MHFGRMAHREGERERECRETQREREGERERERGGVIALRMCFFLQNNLNF